MYIYFLSTTLDNLFHASVNVYTLIQLEMQHIYFIVIYYFI